MGIRAEHLSYACGGGTAFAQPALRDVSSDIPDGQFVGFTGHTGFGKSMLIQHLNGLIRATEDKLSVDGEDIHEKGHNTRAFRTKVGFVFQHPEHQLSKIDMFQDVYFGPKNMGLSRDEIKRRAREAFGMVGLPESFYRKSLFEPSGGQKCRVAITGVLAMRLEVLVLDEPTAGFDPRGRDEILDHVKELNHSWGLAVILVFYSMEDVTKYADRPFVMSDGERRLDGTPEEVFKYYAELEALGLSMPQVIYLVQKLCKAGMPLSDEITTAAEAWDALLPLLKGGALC